MKGKAMKKLKLDPVQRHQLLTALSNANSVLTALKQQKLEGQALADMKTLEVAVQNIECVRLSAVSNVK